MKKFIFSVALLGMMMTSCNKCQHVEVIDGSDVDTVAVLNLENVISLNRQDMYLNYGEEYRWYESCILLKDYLDEENDGTIAGISNVFQVVTSIDDGCDTHVVLFSCTPTDWTKEVKKGFWVEDFPLENEIIAITFKEAYDKIMSVNMPKPHSRHCVLRKEVGPNNANPQYIFGNSEAQIYVDATTGEVSDVNPVFPTE